QKICQMPIFTGTIFRKLENIIRIVLLAVLSHFFTMDISSEPFHSLMGITIFIFAIIFLFAFKSLLSWTEKATSSGS
ncbi:MAG: hypothetical protein J7K15_08975, partial [Deltaproteobacteria bacterium]|nr:hypothetical protein [Deltaproteobacteria bacterium]